MYHAHVTLAKKTGYRIVLQQTLTQFQIKTNNLILNLGCLRLVYGRILYMIYWKNRLAIVVFQKQNVGCSDINECLLDGAEDYCGTNSLCIDMDGWTLTSIFYCDCLPGYKSWTSNSGDFITILWFHLGLIVTKNSGCQDIDECNDPR